MSVRAKFKVNRIEKSIWNGTTSADEMSTVVLSPVYANNDPEHENSKFWKYTPSGEVKLGTINKEAADYFELGEEYYLDFTKAEKAESVTVE